MAEKFTSLDINVIQALHNFGGLIAYQAVFLDTVMFRLETQMSSFDEEKIDAEVQRLVAAGFPARKREFLVSFGNAFSVKDAPDLKGSVGLLLETLKASQVDILPRYVTPLTLALDSGDSSRLLDEAKAFVLMLNQHPACKLLPPELLEAAINVRNAIHGPSPYVMPPAHYMRTLEQLVREMSAALPPSQSALVEKANQLLKVDQPTPA